MKARKIKDDFVPFTMELKIETLEELKSLTKYMGESSDAVTPGAEEIFNLLNAELLKHE